MAFKVVIFACVAVQMAYTQCLPQVIPACQQQIYAQQPILAQPPIVQPSILPQTTVIQDSSVSNNLANALQLLVVSSLLNNALPFNQPEIIVPGPCGPVVSPTVITNPCNSPCGSVGLPQAVIQGPYGAIGPVVSPYGSLVSEVISPVGYTSVVSPQYLTAPGLPGCGCGGIAIY